MKKLITPIVLIVCIILVVIVYVNQSFLVDKFTYYIENNSPVIPDEISDYYKDYSLSFAQNTDDFTPYSYQDLINILFSAINRGYDSFTFYCPDEYVLCRSDVEKLSADTTTITHVNNLVHPFNSFTTIMTSISELGEVNIGIDYLYDDNDVRLIDEAADQLLDELISRRDTDEEAILILHDYIINNTSYDISINKNEESPYKSSTAYGAMFEGYAICNGYTDLMAIFLNKLDIVNIKVATTQDEISYSNTGHVWNAVYLDDTWLHLDLTWDDPVSEDGSEYLFHTYYLLTTEEITELDNSSDVKYEEHNFNKVIYYELK
ncbi:MAG: transglutaminase domain-containing protein [bacterium]